MSTPIPVTPKLLQWIEQSGHPQRHVLSKLVYERDVFGQNKYNRALHAFDLNKQGVPYDFNKEAMEEAGDLAQYMFALVLEGRSLQPLRPILEQLLWLVDSTAVHDPNCDMDEDCTCHVAGS